MKSTVALRLFVPTKLGDGGAMSKGDPPCTTAQVPTALIRPVVPGCAGCAMAHPEFGRSVNPISTRRNRLCLPNYYWHTQIFRPSDGPALEETLYFEFWNVWFFSFHKTGKLMRLITDERRTQLFLWLTQSIISASEQLIRASASSPHTWSVQSKQKNLRYFLLLFSVWQRAWFKHWNLKLEN